MPTIMQKNETHNLINQMPPNATWIDLQREIYVREVIEHDLADSNESLTKDVKEVCAKYGFP
jgi:hypothetical protein